MASSSFRILYDNSPRGRIRKGYHSTRGIALLTHTPSQDSIPNEIVYAPGLADRLVRWARGYLDNNVERQPSQGLEYLAESISRQLVNPEVMREGAVASLYSRTAVTWSSDFVASADGLSMQDIQFLECTKNVQRARLLAMDARRRNTDDSGTQRDGRV